MTLIKGRDVKEEREPSCGCLTKWYPVGPENDMLHWIVVKRTMDMEEKWRFQTHKHKDFEEYWFVTEGNGKFYVGDKVYDVEPGDLLISPRGVPHRLEGDITIVACMCKHNVYGQTLGTREPYEAVDEPYRDNPEERPKAGEYMEIDMATKI